MLKSTIIRVLAFGALFAYVLPTAFGLLGDGAKFAFTGGPLAALGVGAAYMVAMFAVLTVIGLCTKPLNLSIEKRKSMAPLWGTVFFIATMLCLLFAHSLVPMLGLTVVGWLPSVVGSTVAIAVMWATMPAESSQSAS